MLAMLQKHHRFSIYTFSLFVWLNVARERDTIVCKCVLLSITRIQKKLKLSESELFSFCCSQNKWLLLLLFLMMFVNSRWCAQNFVYIISRQQAREKLAVQCKRQCPFDTVAECSTHSLYPKINLHQTDSAKMLWMNKKKTKTNQQITKKKHARNR